MAALEASARDADESACAIRMSADVRAALGISRAVNPPMRTETSNDEQWPQTRQPHMCVHTAIQAIGPAGCGGPPKLNRIRSQILREHAAVFMTSCSNAGGGT